MKCINFTQNTHSAAFDGTNDALKDGKAELANLRCGYSYSAVIVSAVSESNLIHVSASLNHDTLNEIAITN